MTPPEPHLSEREEGGVAVVTVVDDDRARLQDLHRSLSAATTPPVHLVVVALGDDRLVDWSPDEDGVPLTVVPLSARPDQRPWVDAANAGASVALEHGADVVVFTEVDRAPDEVAADLEPDDADREGLWWSTAGTVVSFGVTRDAWVRLGGLPEEDVDTVFDDAYLTRVARDAEPRS